VHPTYDNEALTGALERFRGILVTLGRALIHLLRTDVIYCRSHFALFPLSVMAWLVRKPVVQEVNGPYDDVFLAWPQVRRFQGLLTMLMRWQAAHASIRITVTPGLARWIERESGGGRTIVVPNAADVDIFRPAPRAEKPSASSQYAIFFGRLAPWQGIETLLDAMRSVNWPSSLSLLIVGEGPLQSAVELAVKEGLPIRYLARIPQRELAKLVAGAVASVCPQGVSGGRNATGLSALKFYESLACGVPIVAARWPGHAEVISQEDCGILVEPGDADAVARGLAALISSPEDADRLGKNARRYAERCGSWAARARETSEILSDVLGSNDFSSRPVSRT
jgi:glycosyltransferase involved in cell wall biosynthesis